MDSIGADRNSGLPEETYRSQLEAMRKKNDELFARRSKVRDGWGEKYRERVRAKGKLTTWDRIERLRDPGSPVWPLGTLVKESSAAGDVSTTGTYGLERFDPPVELLSDYTNAVTNIVNTGYKGTPPGAIKLTLMKGGGATTYNGWVWCVLRIWKIEDLGQGA